MLKLFLAKTPREVIAALGKNTYSFDTHRKLTNNYTVVAKLSDGNVVDSHSDFMHAGQSEHSLFIRSFEKLGMDLHAPVPGPKRQAIIKRPAIRKAEAKTPP